MTLEEKFHREMLSGDETLRKDHGYNAAYYRQLVHQCGGLEAAHRLLQSRDAQAGLFKLWELGRLDLSMENLVLQPKYASLFTEDELKIARKRLEDLNFQPVIAPAASARKTTGE